VVVDVGVKTHLQNDSYCIVIFKSVETCHLTVSIHEWKDFLKLLKIHGVCLF
jgi:hypothetical protein